MLRPFIWLKSGGLVNPISPDSWSVWLLVYLALVCRTFGLPNCSTSLEAGAAIHHRNSHCVPHIPYVSLKRIFAQPSESSSKPSWSPFSLDVPLNYTIDFSAGGMLESWLRFVFFFCMKHILSLQKSKTKPKCKD